MKQFQFLSGLILAGILSISAIALADHGVGNGANVVTLPDDKKSLADYYVEFPADNEFKTYADLPWPVQAELERIGFLMVRLGAEVDQQIPSYDPDHLPSPSQINAYRMNQLMTRSGVSRFLEQEVKNPKTVHYFFLDTGKMPTSCVSANDVVLPEGASSDLAACTQGSYTYVDRAKFLSLSIRDQALLILHERLHHVLNENPHFVICEITAGLNRALKQFDDQLSGARTVLSSDDIVKIHHVIDRMSDLKLLAAQDGIPAFETQMIDWTITPDGGLAHKTAKVLGHLGVGSILGENGVLEAGAEMMYSACYLPVCQVTAGAVVVNTVIAPAYQGLAANMNSNLDESSFVATVGNQAHIESSEIRIDDSNASLIPIALQLDVGAQLNGANLSNIDQISLGKYASISKSIMSFQKIGPANTILSLTLGGSSKILGVTPHPIPFTGLKKNESDANPAIDVPANTTLDFSTTGGVCPAATPQWWPWFSGRQELGNNAAWTNLCRTDQPHN